MDEFDFFRIKIFQNTVNIFKVLDAAGNSALDILVGGETCFEMETKCLEKEDLLQAIEFLMDNGVAPKDDLVIDKEERMSRETREHVKELINRRKSQVNSS